MKFRSGSRMLDAEDPHFATAALARAAADWTPPRLSSESDQRSTRPSAPDRTFSFGPFCLVPVRLLLLRNGIPVRIGSRALCILTEIVERRGELVTRDELMAAAWPNLFVHESNLKVNVANLRRSLDDVHRDPTYIVTVIGRGYRFVAPVEIGATVDIVRNIDPACSEG